MIRKIDAVTGASVWSLMFNVTTVVM